MSHRGNFAQNGKSPERPGKFAVIGLLVGVAAAIAAFVVIDNFRLILGGVLILAGAALGIVWKFTGVSESPRYRNGTVTLLIVALVIGGIYLLVHDNKTSPGPVKPPSLSFALASPAKVPWCRTYQVTVRGRVPAGYRIVMFDSAADPDYNFTGPYNYDGTVAPVPRVSGEFTSQHIFIGDRYAIRNGKRVSNVGFKAVVVALLVPNQSAAVLAHVVAAPTGWGLRQLPGNLAEKVLDVERNNNAAHCFKHP